MKWLLFLPAFSLATTFIIRPLPDVANDAPIIIRGTAGKSYSDWVQLKDGTQRIFTFTEMTVMEAMKGDVNTDSIVVREIGGTKDGVGMTVAGTSKFTPGEEVVMFLGEQNDDAEGSHSVWSMMLGKYNINKDEAGEEYLTGGVIGAEGKKPHGIPAPQSEHTQSEFSQPRDRWTVSAFKNMLREQAERRASKTIKEPSSGKSVEKAKTLPASKPYHSEVETLAHHRHGHEHPEQEKKSGKIPFAVMMVVLCAALAGIGFLIKRRRI